MVRATFIPPTFCQSWRGGSSYFLLRASHLCKTMKMNMPATMPLKKSGQTKIPQHIIGPITSRLASLFWHVRNGETVNLLHLASSPLSRFPQKCVLARFPSQPYPRPVFPAKTRPARLLSPAMVAPRLSPCFFGFQSQPIFNPSDRPTLCRICIIHLYSFSNITDGQGLCLSCMFVLSVMYGYTTLQGAYRVAKAPHRVPMGLP